MSKMSANKTGSNVVKHVIGNNSKRASGRSGAAEQQPPKLNNRKEEELDDVCAIKVEKPRKSLTTQERHEMVYGKSRQRRDGEKKGKKNDDESTAGSSSGVAGGKDAKNKRDAKNEKDAACLEDPSLRIRPINWKKAPKIPVKVNRAFLCRLQNRGLPCGKPAICKTYTIRKVKEKTPFSSSSSSSDSSIHDPSSSSSSSSDATSALESAQSFGIKDGGRKYGPGGMCPRK